MSIDGTPASSPASDGFRFAIGSDIGGTFTDVVLVDGSTGTSITAKVPTTTSSPDLGVVAGLEEVLGRTGIGGEGVPPPRLVHATTLVANAIIERKGARTALITTMGFRDVLELRRHVRVNTYELWNDPPEAMVPRRFRFEIDERMDSSGRVIRTISTNELDTIADALARHEIQSVAVCLINSYVNPSHEVELGEWLHDRLPEIAISLSSEVLPRAGEFERFTACVLNAYVAPLARDYLTRLSDRVIGRLPSSPLHVMLSSGGVTGIGTAMRFPIRLVESGPVAGAVMALDHVAAHDLDQCLAFDMGGTTAKAFLAKDGVLTLTSDMEVARTQRFQPGSGYPIGTPSVDLIEIGAGGGSIAKVGRLGVLEVGPESAGADPGPACYGRGGTVPTVTDADLVLGYVDPAFFLGGAMPLDVDSAHRSIGRLGDELGRPVLDTAWAIHDVVNEQMAGAVRMHLAEKGGDSRYVTMVAFGGAGPVHAYNVARKLHVERFLVPPLAGVGSALGLVSAEPAFDAVRSYVAPLDDFDSRGCSQALLDLEKAARAELESIRDGDDVICTYFLECSYVGQGYPVLVAVPNANIDRPAIEGRFAEAYLNRYGYFYEDVPIGIVGLRVKARWPQPRRAAAAHDPKSVRSIEKHVRAAYSAVERSMIDFAIVGRHHLRDGQSRGPLVVEEPNTAVVIDVGGSVTVEPDGCLLVSVAERGGAEQ